MDLYKSFEEVAFRCSQTIAIYDEKMHAKNSYEKFKYDVDDFASKLHELEIKKGDRVLLLVPMSYKLYVALIALFKVGATAVFVDPSQSAAFVNHASLIAQPKALICSPKALLLKMKFRALFKIPLTITTRKIPLYHSMNEKANVEYKAEDIEESTPALMTFTSGSTGMPKAIVRTHQFLQTQYETLRPYIELKEGDVDLTALPIFLLANLLSGMSSVIADVSLQNPKKIDADRLVESMNHYRVQRAGASPALFEQLVQSSQKLQREAEAFYIGGAPVLPSLLQKLHERFPSTALHVLYGSTEAEPISHYRFEMITDAIYEKMLSGEGLYVGKVVDEIALEFLDDGEIIVSGAHVVESYYNNEGDRENKLHRDGTIWHKTGDVGKLDAQNNLWLLGRKSALIYKNGKVLHPFSIEVAMREKSQKMAALLEKEGEVILYTESNMLDVKFEGVDKVTHIKTIPLDRRHNAKVDYVALKKI